MEIKERYSKSFNGVVMRGSKSFEVGATGYLYPVTPTGKHRGAKQQKKKKRRK